MFRSRLFQGFKQCKNTVMPKRKLGSGGAHGHGHEVSKGPLKPYEVPHHPTYANEAYFLGINPNEKYQWQGYEAAILVYLLAFGILASPSKVEDDDLRVSIYFLLQSNFMFSAAQNLYFLYLCTSIYYFYPYFIFTIILEYPN